MTPISLIFTAAFVVIVALVSMWQRLELERDLLIGSVRAAVQLIAVGYVLLYVFELESWPAMIAMLAVMVAVATRNAAKRGRGLPSIHWPVLTAIVAAESVTMGLMLALRIIPPTPRYVISISGMIIGNAMIVAGLLLNRLQSEMAARRGEVEVWLALGATPRQAAGDVLKSAVKASMIPSIDALKTVGLVQLPGMMTGQILAGANPIQAVQYQILIMFSLAAAAAVCSITLGRLSLPLFFNRDAQLVR
jgi:putative ABC transport system permease protein